MLQIDYIKPNKERFNLDELIEIFGYDVVLEETVNAINQQEEWFSDYENDILNPKREIVALARQVGDDIAANYWLKVIEVVFVASDEYQGRFRWVKKLRRDLARLYGEEVVAKPLDATTIKETIDLVQLVQSYGVKLHKVSAGKWRAPCPLHTGDRDPSFFVYEDRKGFYCYGCHQGGSAIDFVMRADGIDFKTACQVLSRI